MNKSLLFTRLDYITVKPYLALRTLLIMFIVVIWTAVFTKNVYMISAMLMVYGSIFATYPFAAGDKSSVDTLYAIVPLKKKNVVAGRYIFSLSFNLAICVFAFIVSIVVSLILRESINILELLSVLLTFYSCSIILLSVQLPIFFKLGYTKAKLLSNLPILFVFVGISLVQIAGENAIMAFFTNVFNWVGNNIVLTIIIIVVVCIIGLFGSAYLSYKFYSKREF